MEVSCRKEGFELLFSHRAKVRKIDHLRDASVCREKCLNELLPNQLNRAELHLVGALSSIAEMGELLL